MLALGWRAVRRGTGSALTNGFHSLLAGLAVLPPVLSVRQRVVSLGFCCRHAARMALDDLSALLRRGRDLFGFCDGAELDHPDPENLPPRKCYHVMRHINNAAIVMSPSPE